MITCPVCEHQQAAGSECELCGRHLVEGRGTDAPVVPLEGLEATLLAPVDGGAVEPMGDLEPTLRAAVADAAGGPGEGLVLEPTLASPVEVGLDVVPDLERIGDGLPDDLPTLVPAVVICRYCRTEAAAGERRCGRCGMRLPEQVPAPAAQAPAGPRLCSCGTPVTRSRCPACGARNATE
jgi:hypothetical protein